eukprot:TRINITY_DN1275_c0_g1_i1.p1 TRINITY_DN1275_c0_g1~~TRINITY_DN1275_c0_g1_i1.p1  ORF type:complete len:942 (+),score=83.35 TRINITY_DN1275_c0_g1_i1:234-2828(+)
MFAYVNDKGDKRRVLVRIEENDFSVHPDSILLVADFTNPKTAEWVHNEFLELRSVKNPPVFELVINKVDSADVENGKGSGMELPELCRMGFLGYFETTSSNVKQLEFCFEKIILEADNKKSINDLEYRLMRKVYNFLRVESIFVYKQLLKKNGQDTDNPADSNQTTLALFHFFTDCLTTTFLTKISPYTISALLRHYEISRLNLPDFLKKTIYGNGLHRFLNSLPEPILRSVLRDFNSGEVGFYTGEPQPTPPPVSFLRKRFNRAAACILEGFQAASSLFFEYTDLDTSSNLAPILPVTFTNRNPMTLLMNNIYLNALSEYLNTLPASVLFILKLAFLDENAVIVDPLDIEEVKTKLYTPKGEEEEAIRAGRLGRAVEEASRASDDLLPEERRSLGDDLVGVFIALPEFEEFFPYPWDDEDKANERIKKRNLEDEQIRKEKERREEGRRLRERLLRGEPDEEKEPKGIVIKKPQKVDTGNDDLNTTLDFIEEGVVSFTPFPRKPPQTSLKRKFDSVSQSQTTKKPRLSPPMPQFDLGSPSPRPPPIQIDLSSPSPRPPPPEGSIDYKVCSTAVSMLNNILDQNDRLFGDLEEIVRKLDVLFPGVPFAAILQQYQDELQLMYGHIWGLSELIGKASGRQNVDASGLSGGELEVQSELPLHAPSPVARPSGSPRTASPQPDSELFARAVAESASVVDSLQMTEDEQMLQLLLTVEEKEGSAKSILAPVPPAVELPVGKDSQPVFIQVEEKVVEKKVQEIEKKVKDDQKVKEEQVKEKKKLKLKRKRQEVQVAETEAFKYAKVDSDSDFLSKFYEEEKMKFVASSYLAVSAASKSGRPIISHSPFNAVRGIEGDLLDIVTKNNPNFK